MSRRFEVRADIRPVAAGAAAGVCAVIGAVFDFTDIAYDEQDGSVRAAGQGDLQPGFSETALAAAIAHTAWMAAGDFARVAVTAVPLDNGATYVFDAADYAAWLRRMPHG